MTASEVGPARVERRWLVVAAVLVGVAVVVGAVAIGRLTGHGDPDPGDRIMSALRTIEAAVPHDATALGGHDAEAHWDSCDGREGTFGWSPVSVSITFRAPAPPDAMFAFADDQLAAAGWTAESAATARSSEERDWFRHLPDGLAQAHLTPQSTYDGVSMIWLLQAHAPAHGRSASGC